MAEQLPSPSHEALLLAEMEDLGPGTGFTNEIQALVGRSPFFAEFTRTDIEQFADYMRVYRARQGQTIIHEGDTGDYMLLIIKGEVEILKKNLLGVQQEMASVLPGMTLGEMSMIDGEPRFASCMAVRETVFATLTRDNMAKIILEKPSLGAKVLVKLVTMLSQRLRQTSIRLLQYMK